MTQRETYTVQVAGLERHLPLFEVSPGVRIAIVNILGDTELVQATAQALGEKLAAAQPEVLVTAEAKSIPLIHALSVVMQRPYVVLRKSYKPYMGNALSAETYSITTGQPQTLYLDEKDRGLVKGKKVAIVDDVISTGSTLQGMRLIIEKAEAKIIAQAAIFTEGDRAQWKEVIALGHLPVFLDKKE
jgi:adenine phosphoribosyltransferase